MSNEQIFEIIIARLDRFEKKLDGLVESKWKIYGGCVAIVAVFTFGFNLLTKLK